MFSLNQTFEIIHNLLFSKDRWVWGVVVTFELRCHYSIRSNNNKFTFHFIYFFNFIHSLHFNHPWAFKIFNMAPILLLVELSPRHKPSLPEFFRSIPPLVLSDDSLIPLELLKILQNIVRNCIVFTFLFYLFLFIFYVVCLILLLLSLLCLVW